MLPASRQSTWNRDQSWPGLRFIAVEPLTVSMQPWYGSIVSQQSASVSLPVVQLETSINDGQTWQSFTPGETSVEVQAGSKLFVRAESEVCAYATSIWPNVYADEASCFGWKFDSNGGKFDLAGKFVSLTSSTCADESPIGHLTFSHLFYGSTVRSVSNLILPSVLSAKGYCCNYMLSGCSQLLDTPVFKSRVCHDQTYYKMCNHSGVQTISHPLNMLSTRSNSTLYSMFSDCQRLYEVPDFFLSAHVSHVGNQEFTYMFDHCTSLKRVPKSMLSFADGANAGIASFSRMFANCSSLTAAPDLPEVHFQSNSYNAFSYMFESCTSLVSGPKKLPDGLSDYVPTSVADHMFYSCSSLTAAPDIPLPEDISYGRDQFAWMFYRCTSMLKPPSKLAASKLGYNSYGLMFSGCRSLTSIPELPELIELSSNSMRMIFANGLKANIPFPKITLVLNGSGVSQAFKDCGWTDASRLSIEMDPCLSGVATNEMFRFMLADCTSLTAGPACMPGISANNTAYSRTFAGCTSLSTFPVLCCKSGQEQAFEGLYAHTNARQVKVCLTSWGDSSLSATKDWLLNVPDGGTFIGPSCLLSSMQERSASTVPASWTLCALEEWEATDKLN